MTKDALAPLRGSSVLLAVTGGIAAYKSAELLRLFQKAGADVTVVMTHSATRFVAPATFEALSHREVGLDTFDQAHRVEHVRLAREADLVVVAPATAHVLAQMRAGLAGDLVTNILLTTTAPILCAAAMHTEMWEHPATRDNVRVLRERGISILDPDVGDLAGGDVGIGRLAELDDIRTAAAKLLSGVERKPSSSYRGDLFGVRVLVTAGGTQEPIDAVRVISNRSSGRMGYAIAAAAAARGAKVCLVTAPSRLVAPPVDETVNVTTAAEMADAVLERFGDMDVVIKAAAVADFTPAHPAAQKRAKSEGAPHLELVPTLDILKALGERRTEQILIGFAAETHDHIDHARDKLERKNLDLLVVNDVSRSDIGFDVAENEVTLLFRDGTSEAVEKRSKDDLADLLCDRIRKLYENRSPKEHR